jgi:hypothetical protein
MRSAHLTDAHTIRLRGPWEYRLLESAKYVEAQQGRVDISNTDLLRNVVGKIELMRRFNRPTGLGNGTRVELVVGSRTHAIAIDLNGEPLSITLEELRYDITAQLRSHNVLRIIVDTGQQKDIRLDDVRLEIQTS